MNVTVEKQSNRSDDKVTEVFPLNIKIKQEKTTSYEDSSKSETVDKLSIDVNLTNIFSTTITSSSAGAEKDADAADVKPSIEPLKSSNEILTELFRVFNAAPPEIIEDDSNEASEVKEKKKKKHKHRKKSKKKKGTESETDGELSENPGEDGEIRVKKKKIKKEKDRDRKHEKHEKHEKHKRKHRGETLLVTVKQEPLDKDEKKSKYDEVHQKESSKEHSIVKHDETKQKDHNKLKESRGEDSKQPLKGKIQIKSLKDSAIFKELATGSSHTKERDHDKHYDRDKSIGLKSSSSELRKRKCSGSDFSISDGEDPGKGRYYDFYQKKYNSFYASYERGEDERERHEKKRRRRSSDRDRERRRRSGSGSRSRSRSHSPEQFDKQKLLEIARKNAISMLKKGTLPGAQNLDGESKTKLISKMRASGKTIEELTEFCKKISNKDNFNDLSSVSSDESDHDADGATKVFHHPFQLKEPAPIVMNIRNATTIQPKSAEEKKALLMQFPVSSGAHHRSTETEWVPVEPKKPAPATAPAKPAASETGAVGKSKLKTILPPSSTFVPQSSNFPSQHVPQPGPSLVPAPNAPVPHVSQPTISHPSAGPPIGPAAFPTNDISQPYHALHVPPIVPHQPPVAQTPFNGMPGSEPQPLPVPVDTTVPPPLLNPMLSVPHPEMQHHQQRPHFPPVHSGSPGHRPGNGHGHGPGFGHGHGNGPPFEPGAGPMHGHSHGPGNGHEHGHGNGHGIGNNQGHGLGPGHGPVNDPGPGPNNVFQTQPDAPMLDVSQIVSQRLNAMRRLQENPADPEARQLLYTTQKDMSTWASSKVMPGQFVGSTGVNCLSQRELAEGYQPWATRDMMKQSAPVTGGMGMHLLQKMGWQPGEGLGKEKNGSLQPLLLDVKLDKRGLGEEQNKARPHQFPGQLFTRRDNAQRPPPGHDRQRFMNVKVNTDGKHPVSILGEYATKRKWNVPRYELVHESGPGHAKNFIFKVLVNGLEYQPAISNNTKKEAKATAAKFCLQQLGVMIT
ncbi:protein Son [Anopheles ziemanni]|uniref:protein Son n=1 Tax=Anopheles coustani TaxID=139045 RepID=UPI00265A6728|nr:protein Son [Anopheles coustani]XP_058174794.1 protein Son [Anopheles ziemanni]